MEVVFDLYSFEFGLRVLVSITVWGGFWFGIEEVMLLRVDFDVAFIWSFVFRWMDREVYFFSVFVSSWA